MAKTNVGSVPVVSPTSNPSATPSLPSPGTGVGTGNGTSTGTAANPPKGFRLQAMQMLQGVQTVLPVGSTVSTASGSLTQASMVGQLQTIMQAYQAADDEGVSLKEARQSIKTNLIGWRDEYAQMKAVIIAFFGATSPQLTKFGLKQKSKPKPLTTAQKMARTVRAAQTRVIRGTLGAVAKKGKKYTGAVTISSDLGAGTGAAASTAPGSGSPTAAPAQSAQASPVAAITTVGVPVSAPAIAPVAAPVATQVAAPVVAPAAAPAPASAPVAPVAPAGTPPKSA